MLKCKCLSVCFVALFCLLSASLSVQNAFGSAWIGEDDGGGHSGGSGDGQARDCNKTGKGYNNAQCNGAAWVFYSYMGGHDNEDVHFAPGYSSRTIPGDCAKSDVPNYGFWHLGFYVEFNGKHNPLTADLIKYSNGGLFGTDYDAKVGYALTTSHGSLNYGRKSNGYSFYRTTSNTLPLYHVIMKDGSPMYEATKYGPDWNGVKDAYAETVEEYNRLHGTSLNPNKPSSGLWAFCSTPDGVIEKKVPIEGSITATIDGVVYANNATYAATNDRTVINYTDTVYIDDNYTFSVQVCYQGSDNQDNQSYYGACHYYTPSSKSDSHNSSVSISTPEGMTEITVCHYLDHPAMINSRNQTEGNKRVTHCIRINRPKPENLGGNCGDMGISYDDYTAYTDAQMIFKLNERSTILGYNGTGISKIEWAKPGDNVQYEYKMCSSSEYARLAEHDLDPKGFGSSDVPKFDLFAKKNGSNNSAYLFGHTPTTYTNSNMSNYYVGFTSPNSTFTCSYNGGKATKANFYQIPAESGASCKSASDVARYSDVGSTFEQQLTYRKISTRKYSELKSEPYTVLVCSGTYPNRYCWTEWRTRYWYEYGTEKASNSSQTLIGTVKVPYNYALVPYMKHGGDGIAFAGAKFNTQAFIATIPRINKQVQETAYATRTKETKIIVASFTMTGATLPIDDVRSSRSGAITASTVCSVASNGRSDNCKTVHESTSTLNQTNNMLNGASDEMRSISNGDSNVDSAISAEVPYVVPGTKFCVAVGVSPADSHGTGDNSRIDDNSQSVALSNSGGGYRVGPPACVTVAKKPMFSVESSQIVTNGSIKTSTTNANGRVYGSWSEYGIVASGSVRNMGSGAAYGYTSPYYNVATSGFGINKASANAGMPKSATSNCAYSPQTFGNVSCSLGSATTIKNSVDSMAVARKINDIYYMTKAEMNDGYISDYGLKDIAEASEYHRIPTASRTISGSSKQFVRFSIDGSRVCQYSDSLGRYITPAADGSAYAMVGGSRVAPFYCTPTGEKYYKSTKDTYLTGTGSSLSTMRFGSTELDHLSGTPKPTYRNAVYVIDVEGTLVIDVNIAYTNIERYQALDQIPTVLIFADEVIITDRVERLDAWIIAGLNRGSGKINTCGAVGYFGKVINKEDLNSDMCNKPLEINGAVYAKEIILNRTYGGGGQSGDSESTIKTRFSQRSEIINLRSDAYYWAYYQSQRNRILTTVYARELPTRY